MTPAVIDSAGVVTYVSRFSFGADSSSSVMAPPPKSAEAKATASAPEFSFETASLLSAATPASCRLGISHALLIRHHNVPTTRKRLQIIITLCPALYTTTLKMVGGSLSPRIYIVKIRRLGNEFPIEASI